MQQSAIVKAIKGGNFTIFSKISEVLKLPLEKLAATNIPKVVTTTNEPGWSTMIAVFNPSAPYKASMMGNPTKEVLLNPPVNIKQPINFFAHTSYFWPIVAFANVWKETGWNAIIYLAAITAIDPSL